MKTVAILSLILTAANASAAAVVCQTSSFTATASYDDVTGKWAGTYKKGSAKPQTEPLIAVETIQRAKFEKDPYLQRLLQIVGLKPQNTLGATAYIFNRNTIGDSGILVIRTGRGGTQSPKVYFAAPVNYAEACK